jgi:uncharacterized membrane protein
VHPLAWSIVMPAVGSAFLASLVEATEAFTLVLAAASLGGGRPAAIGTTAALGLLAGAVAIFGPLLEQVPLAALQLAIGVLLLLFGMGWLRKAILRAAGILALHDEAAIFAAQTGRRALGGWMAGLTAFKAVLLEGLEVAFIVIAVGAGRGLWLPAGLGAGAACLLVLGLGLALRRPLARVPENTLKFGVGTMLSAFGVFWTGEGLGIAWPGEDAALAVFGALFLLAGLATASLLRRSQREVLP